MTNSSFDLGMYDNSIKSADILSTYKSVATYLTKVVLFQVALSDIL